jgi:hypothetical protein
MKASRYFFSPFIIRRVDPNGSVHCRAPWSPTWIGSVTMLEDLEQMAADPRLSTREVTEDDGNKIHEKPTP